MILFRELSCQFDVSTLSVRMLSHRSIRFRLWSHVSAFVPVADLIFLLMSITKTAWQPPWTWSNKIVAVGLPRHSEEHH